MPLGPLRHGADELGGCFISRLVEDFAQQLQAGGLVDDPLQGRSGGLGLLAQQTGVDGGDPPRVVGAQRERVEEARALAGDVDGAELAAGDGVSAARGRDRAEDLGGPTKYGITLETLVGWRFPNRVTPADVKKIVVADPAQASAVPSPKVVSGNAP